MPASSHRLVFDLPSGLVGFLDYTIDGRALCPAELLAELLEHLLKPLDLLVRLFEMTLQSGDQVMVGRLLDHFGQRFNDLLLGVIDVLQTMEQQVLHRFYVLGEDSHIRGLLSK
jgi:hypothetical protein